MNVIQYKTDKEYISYLVKKHYKPKKTKGVCNMCGKERVLGKRGKAKRFCVKCRKTEYVKSLAV